MLLNNNTLSIVNSLQLISDSVIFHYPITGIKDSASSICAFVDLSKLENDNFGEDFGILKMKELMELIKIVGNDANIEKDDSGIISISNNSMRCRYLTTSISAIESTYGVKLSMLDNVRSTPTVFSFTLTNNTADKLKRTSSLLNFEDMILTTDNEQVKITTSTKDVEGNEFSVTVPAENVTEQSNIFISIKNLKRLPTADYTVHVRKNLKHNNVYILEFIPEGNDALTILIPSKAYNKE